MITKQDMKIINPRRIPVEGSFINYDSNDILYGIMYANATYHPEEKKLYLSKKNFALMKKVIRECAGITNSAMSERHLNKLKEKNLILEEKENYYFPQNIDEKYRIIESEFLNYLANTRPKNTIRIYIKLLDWYLWKQKEKAQFIFTNKDILTILGYSTDNKVASKMVSNVLESLQREGIISYEEFYEKMILKTGQEINSPKKRLLFVASKKSELKK